MRPLALALVVALGVALALAIVVARFVAAAVIATRFFPALVSPFALVVVPLTVLIAYVVFSLCGFGSTLITQDVLLAAALLVPAMALGLWLGNRWHAKITRAQAVRAIGAVLTLSGASLLLRAL